MPEMSTRMLFSIAAFSLFGFSNAMNPSSRTKTSVIVMRHCVRSTGDDGLYAKAGYEKFDDYSSEKWPAFVSPAMYCLPRGERIIEAQGIWLRTQGGLPLPIRAIADDVPGGQRDNVTMHSFLKGLAPDAEEVTASVSGAPFRPAKNRACDRRRDETAGKQVMQEFIDASPFPSDYEANLRRLYEILGRGSAGNWTSIPCTAEEFSGPSAMPVGACQAASEITERLLMEWGGNVQPLGWGRVNASEIPSLLGLHAWHFRVWNAGPGNYKRGGASMLRDVASRLTKAEPGTTLYVGHDSDLAMLLGALGLTWDPSPFPANATLPGSMLRFDREGDTITASYNYVQDFSTADVDAIMAKVPATFWSSSSSNNVSLAQFHDLVNLGSFAECANSDQEETLVV